MTLLNGTHVAVGSGGSYSIGSDTYPITIVGWSASGKVLYYRDARAHPTVDSDPYGIQRYLFTEDPTAPVRTATWRKSSGVYKPMGASSGVIRTDGYHKYMDPSF